MNYKRQYNLLMEKAYKRKSIDNSYFEKHHVIPKCMGGKKYRSLRFAADSFGVSRDYILYRLNSKKYLNYEYFDGVK